MYPSPSVCGSAGIEMRGRRRVLAMSFAYWLPHDGRYVAVTVLFEGQETQSCCAPASSVPDPWIIVIIHETQLRPLVIHVAVSAYTMLGVIHSRLPRRQETGFSPQSPAAPTKTARSNITAYL